MYASGGHMVQCQDGYRDTYKDGPVRVCTWDPGISISSRKAITRTKPVITSRALTGHSYDWL